MTISLENRGIAQISLRRWQQREEENLQRTRRLAVIGLIVAIALTHLTILGWAGLLSFSWAAKIHLTVHIPFFFLFEVHLFRSCEESERDARDLVRQLEGRIAELPAT